jgi:hypothetical protein
MSTALQIVIFEECSGAPTSVICQYVFQELFSIFCKLWKICMSNLRMSLSVDLPSNILVCVPSLHALCRIPVLDGQCCLQF